MVRAATAQGAGTGPATMVTWPDLRLDGRPRAQGEALSCRRHSSSNAPAEAQPSCARRFAEDGRDLAARCAWPSSAATSSRPTPAFASPPSTGCRLPLGEAGGSIPRARRGGWPRSTSPTANRARLPPSSGGPGARCTGTRSGPAKEEIYGAGGRCATPGSGSGATPGAASAGCWWPAVFPAPLPGRSWPTSAWRRRAIAPPPRR
jgi:hypothetical protein